MELEIFQHETKRADIAYNRFYVFLIKLIT